MNRIRLVPLLATVALVLAACTSMPDSASTRLPDLRVAAVSSATIDFESELTGGDLVSELGRIDGDDIGITFLGSVIEGVIGVSGDRTPATGTNHATIFDSTCGGGDADDCTGDDPDLYAPAQGNTLIVQEAGAVLPDDAVGEVFTFDFSGFGPTGTVDVVEFFYIDVEETEAGGAEVVFLDGDGEVTYEITATGDSESRVWPEGVEPAPVTPIVGVSSMVVTFTGSGAIDDIDIRIPVDEEPSEGCTPGYWRNHAGFGPQANMWHGFDPLVDHFSDEDAFDDEITIRGRELGDDGLERGGRPGDIDDPLLYEAVWAIGGDVNALARHAVAALLNASHPDVAYAYTVDDVQTWVKNALNDVDGFDVNDVKDRLVVANEAGCPL